MNIEHFLTDLKIYLRPLSNQQISVVLQYYQDYFTQQIQAGASEQEAVRSAGEPQFLAEQILKRYNLEHRHTQKKQAANGWQEIEDLNESFTSLNNDYSYAPKKANFFQRFLQVSGVLIINLLFMFWILLTMALLIFAGWLTTLAFILSPFAIVIAGVTGFLVQPVLSLSVTLLLFGLGIIGFLICRFLTKYFVKFCRYYFGVNYQVLRG